MRQKGKKAFGAVTLISDVPPHDARQFPSLPPSPPPALTHPAWAGAPVPTSTTRGRRGGGAGRCWRTAAAQRRSERGPAEREIWRTSVDRLSALRCNPPLETPWSRQYAPWGVETSRNNGTSPPFPPQRHHKERSEEPRQKQHVPMDARTDGGRAAWRLVEAHVSPHAHEEQGGRDGPEDGEQHVYGDVVVVQAHRVLHAERHLSRRRCGAQGEEGGWEMGLWPERTKALVGEAWWRFIVVRCEEGKINARTDGCGAEGVGLGLACTNRRREDLRIGDVEDGRYDAVARALHQRHPGRAQRRWRGGWGG